jgi:hypothetical protein
MRDAKNLQTLNLHINQNSCKIDSVWITENGDLYFKIKEKEMTINYQADKIIYLLKEQNLLNPDVKVSELCK